MQLRFHARGTGLVSLPGENRIVGQLPRYIGRTLKLIDGVATWPASEEPFVVEIVDSAARNIAATPRSGTSVFYGSEASQRAARLIKLCARDAALWAADEATAAACGVEFVALDHSDGAWVPASPKPKRASYQTTKD